MYYTVSGIITPIGGRPVHRLREDWMECKRLNFYNKFISSVYMFRVHVLIFRRAKLYYTVSGIITPIGGCPVHRLREDWMECKRLYNTILPS